MTSLHPSFIADSDNMSSELFWPFWSESSKLDKILAGYGWKYSISLIWDWGGCFERELASLQTSDHIRQKTFQEGSQGICLISMIKWSEVAEDQCTPVHVLNDVHHPYILWMNMTSSFSSCSLLLRALLFLKVAFQLPNLTPGLEWYCGHQLHWPSYCEGTTVKTGSLEMGNNAASQLHILHSYYLCGVSRSPCVILGFVQVLWFLSTSQKVALRCEVVCKCMHGILRRTGVSFRVYEWMNSKHDECIRGAAIDY